MSEGYSHSNLSVEFLRIEADGFDPGDAVNKEKRATAVLTALRDSEDEDAARGVIQLAERLLRSGSGQDNVWARGPADWWEETVDALASDGWQYDSDAGRLLPSVTGVEMPEETSFVEEATRRRGWEVAAGHYRQSVAAFADGNWASSNAQLRSFLESLLPEVAGAQLDRKRPKTPVAALQALNSRDELDPGEYNFARGLWEMCQSGGSHPGLSNEDEAHFRLLAVTGYARYMLARLDSI